MSLIESTASSSGLLATTEPSGEPLVQEDEVQHDEPPVRRAPPRQRKVNYKAQLVRWSEDGNIARHIDQDVLDTLGAQVVEEYQLDLTSRADWEETSRKALDFATQKTKPKTTPWPGASNMIFPLITGASFEFGARAYGAVIQNRDVVKGQVWGSDRGEPALGPDDQPKTDQNGQPVWLVKPGEKRERATRISEHMSWQLLTDMPEWEPQTDQLLHRIAIVGGAIKKSFFDKAKKKTRSLYVSIFDLVWSYGAPSFETAPRHTEHVWLYPQEVRERELAESEENALGEGLFLPISYAGGGDPQPEVQNEGGGPGGEAAASTAAADPYAPILYLEQHRLVDLDQDGYPEPYVVTVHKASGKVVQIVARFDEDSIETNKHGEIIKIDPEQQYTMIPFFPNIDGGSYPMGFGHILYALNDAINTTLNQMFDAGTLQNSGAGFIGDNMGMASGDVQVRVGKYVRVNTKGQNIRDSVFPIPFPGPSPVLLQLLGILIEAGKQIAGLQEVLTGDAAKANAPPTTVLALIEQGITGYTAIIKRVLRGMKGEYDKIYNLNRKHLKETQTFQVADQEREISPEDYRLGGGVNPIADPTQTTSMQKLGRAQLLYSTKDEPGVNKHEILTRFYEAAGVERIEDLWAPPDPTAAQVAQLQLQKLQGEIARARAAEQKDAAQSYLFLAQAKAVGAETDSGWIDQQLDVLRLQIEDRNSRTKAAKVEHDAWRDRAGLALDHHKHVVESAHANADRTADLIKHASSLAAQPAGGEDSGTPGPGPAPASPPNGGAMVPVATQSGDTSLLPLPQGPTG